ncbi:MAG: hypothetical protein IPK82_31940 [Polyangiaceae bacterium]|nr:hypothetical protein [Polyangiaceae bacterium]
MGNGVRSVEGHVAGEALERLVTWGSTVPNFERHHAADGLFVALGCCDEVSRARPDDLFLMALNITFWFWVDDRSDKYLNASVPQVNWPNLIAIAEDRSTQQQSPEEAYLTELADRMRKRCQFRGDFERWRATAATSLGGMAWEDKISRKGVSPSYVESVEYGAASVTIVNIMHGAYIVNGTHRAARQADERLLQLERYVGLFQRLINDLYSVEKERKEGPNGRVSNAVIVMEQGMGRSAAKHFVEEQAKGCRRLINERLEELGSADPAARMTRNMLHAIDAYYEHAPVRYIT